MKRTIYVLFALFSSIMMAGLALGQSNAVSPDMLWREATQSSLPKKNKERLVVPSAYRAFTLNKDALENLLRQAPMEFTDEARNTSLIITLPMPDGSFARFRIEESPIMEPGLAVRFPEIKTYRGQGIDDPAATARFDFMPSGFHSMILSPRGTVLVDPYAKGDTENYVSYFKRDAPRTGDFVCHVGDQTENEFYKSDYDSLPKIIPAAEVTSGTTLRTYRLALAATGEYTAAVGGGTVAGAQAAQVLIMNRVNGVYERDLAIRMTIIANNNLIIYTNAATDPYTNDDGSAMLTQNQANLTATIGTANYDIGHVFSTGGGGVAVLQGPCRAALKAQGVTGLPTPTGDAFAIDYVAHEMGHQFGGNHTFNAGGTGQREATAAFEPGSGVTIMGYAGIVGNQDLATHSIDTFHVRSLEEIVAYSQTAQGNNCPSMTATGNTVPAVTLTGGTTWNIPEQTPFALTASATDVNGDAVTYDWQEYDLGAQTNAVPNTDASGGARPIFRPYLPTTSGTRTFPSLQYILNNANVPPSTFDCGRGAGNPCLTGELLPTITRTMLFQVIARDNRANGGGINTQTATVNVTNNIGPFTVTAPNTAVSILGNSTQTVTWNVAGTTGAPVSTANVRILLSTDGGQTFPTVLLASTPNDGSQSVTVPNVQTNQARIKVEAVGNIYFDISNVNFTINVVTAAGVSVGGRVLSAEGYAIANALVSITNEYGETVSVRTNPFGYYHFENVTAGATYILNVASKRYSFNSFVLSVNEEIREFNLTALP